MSVVILGGNECMEGRYRDLCQAYRCQSRIFTKPSGGLKKKLGSPDLMIFFTRCHTSSLSALRGILEKYAGQNNT